jgi:hypothetical protein
MKRIITIHAVARPDWKRRGEAAEAAFLARGSMLGFTVAKPWGDSNRYDFAVGYDSRFWRTQVKLTTYRVGTKYRLRAERPGQKPYTRKQIDFLAAYTMPADVWYIVPIEAFEGLTALDFGPHDKRKGKYEKYRDAWCLLDCSRKARGWKDIPVLCRSKNLEVRCALCPMRG